MWEFRKFEDGRWYRWHLDGAEVFLKKTGEEWRSVVNRRAMNDFDGRFFGPELCEGPASGEATITVTPGDTAALRPVMPDRPYLLSATNAVNLLDGAHARFFVDLPIFLRLETEKGGLLDEFSPFILSNTWFGDKTDGTLCYSLRANLDPLCKGETLEGSNAHPAYRSLVKCGISVKNHSRSRLEFKQLAVYTDLLRIREEEGFLRTDTIIVEGLADGSLKMTVAGGPLPKGARLLSPSRMRQSELLVRRGVAFLRTITGM